MPTDLCVWHKGYLYILYVILNFSGIRLFTNQLMGKFNLKGKGKQNKIGLEGTKLFSAIKGKLNIMECWLILYLMQVNVSGNCIYWYLFYMHFLVCVLLLQRLSSDLSLLPLSLRSEWQQGITWSMPLGELGEAGIMLHSGTEWGRVHCAHGVITACLLWNVFIFVFCLFSLLQVYYKCCMTIHTFLGVQHRFHVQLFQARPQTAQYISPVPDRGLLFFPA